MRISIVLLCYRLTKNASPDIKRAALAIWFKICLTKSVQKHAVFNELKASAYLTRKVLTLLRYKVPSKVDLKKY